MIKNIPQVLTLDVNSDRIERGVQGVCNKCPFALAGIAAFSEATGLSESEFECLVDEFDMSFWLKDEEYNYINYVYEWVDNIPFTWIQMFDENKNLVGPVVVQAKFIR